MEAITQMLTGLFQSGVFCLTGLVYYIVDARLISHYDQHRAEKGSGRGQAYTAFMIVFLALLVVQPILLPRLGLQIGAKWGLLAQVFGLGMIAVALALHWWARLHLQHFYVEDVEIQEGHYVVDTGPYNRVRHPVITSFFLIAVGLLLVNPAVTTLLMVIYVLVDFPRSARREEELLMGKLPQYSSYIERTGRFWPKWR
jgi:protein-S-isoprenylcysteine O-methyltransferase Ste14